MKRSEFAGALREVIRISRVVFSRDALGAASTKSEMVGDFRAAVAAYRIGAEREAESRSALPRWRFTLRGTDVILPGDDLLWNDRDMVIRTVSVALHPVAKTILVAEEKR